MRIVRLGSHSQRLQKDPKTAEGEQSRATIVLIDLHLT
jgi:hypothetical protein